MGLDEVRLAIRRLGPLLRRRGTSPAVGKALRRAVASLDRFLMLVSEPDRGEALAVAISELQACMGIIQESSRPEDREQLDGTAEALALLVSWKDRVGAPGGNVEAVASPPVSPRPVDELATPVISLSPPVVIPTAEPPTQLVWDAWAARPVETAVSTGAAPPSPVLAETPLVERSKGRPRFKATTTDRRLVACLNLLGDLHDRRARSIKLPLLTGRALAAMDSKIAAAVTALDWVVGTGRDGAARIAAASDASVEGRAVALLRLKFRGALDAARAEAGDMVDNDPEMFVLALRLAADSHPDLGLEALSWFSRTSTGESVRAALIPLLVEHAHLSSADLLRLLDDPSDDVACAATSALVWVGTLEVRPELAARIARVTAPRRRAALLFASASLGTGASLAEIRACVDADDEVDALFLTALAVGGNEEDAGRLLKVAARGGSLGEDAVLALAHLGDMRAIQTMEALKDLVDVDAAIIDESLALMAGPASKTPPPAPQAPSRFFRGQPWSVANALAALADADQSVRSRALHALDLSVRTGLRPPGLYDVASPSRRQIANSSLWRERFEKPGRRVSTGLWLYFGRSGADAYRS